MRATCAPSALPRPCSLTRTPKQQCEVAGERQSVAVQDLHACVGGADHIEIGDAAAEVAVKPGADLAVQLVDVEVGRGVGEVDDDVQIARQCCRVAPRACKCFAASDGSLTWTLSRR